LLDRLLKDIVCEAAPHYISQYQDISLIRDRQASSGDGLSSVVPPKEKLYSPPQQSKEETERIQGQNEANKAFSLARFVPLLSERMYVLSPFTRNYLVSWITVLDSVPDLELVTFLPSFLDGLIKYLSDPNTDVRVATAKVLADFLREIQEAAELGRLRKEAEARKAERQQGKDAKANSVESPERSQVAETAGNDESEKASEEDEWISAQEVKIDYAAIMEILLNHISYPDDEIQATTQQWIAEFLVVVKEVVVPFTPRLIPAILPSIAHHSPAIQGAANVTNINLYQVIEQLPWAQSAPAASESDKSSPVQDVADKKINSPPVSPRMRAAAQFGSLDQIDGADSLGLSLSSATPPPSNPALYQDPFDLQTTVNVLTLQLIDEHEETRVAALEWLLMLHQKAPRRILSINDGTFPALLKTLSDPSEDVIRCDLRLLAQMSGASDDAYNSYLANLVNLFSTDRRLLEARGSLIVRQLCTSLHTERVFKTLAEILEKDEDLEFASIMITNLNMILITSPELSDFRKRLKNLETKDGQQLFIGLYKSWCHNSVATLSLCLLAQAYEHASNLLNIFTELEVTVSFLIQIDKLVQLLESPVFMTLRLQLLEPERYPHLLKTLYGLLMLLPQSSAFATLRNRLNAASALGNLHIAGGRSASMSVSAGASSGNVAANSSASNVSNTRSKIIGNNREDLKWNELLVHFKVVQSRHERSRRAGTGQGSMGDSKHSPNAKPGGSLTSSSVNGGNSSRTATSSAGKKRINPSKGHSTSPLNPASSVAKAQLGRASGQAESSGNSFFGLPIGSNNSSSNIATPTSISRPTSPGIPRKIVGGPGTAATPNLISRATSLTRQSNAR
jgi:vacuole morphology and inheritance protein 14